LKGVIKAVNDPRKRVLAVMAWSSARGLDAAALIDIPYGKVIKAPRPGGIPPQVRAFGAFPPKFDASVPHSRMRTH
jgi:hypothetical protein